MSQAKPITLRYGRGRVTLDLPTSASVLIGPEIPAMPTLHPVYLLRNPAHKRLAWRDFLDIKAKLRLYGSSP